MKIFQILHGMCHWETPFKTLDETFGRFPVDCLFVEAPDYVTEQWGFDETEIGDERFIAPAVPEGLVYNDDTGTFMEEDVAIRLLEEAQAAKQSDNNDALANFLATHPLEWTDGKKYGITKEDQNEIAMNLLSYQNEVASGVANPTLEWHAVKEACVPWTLEDLTALSVAIRQAVYPWYNLNQSYKLEIYSAGTVKEVEAILLRYETEEERIKREEEEAAREEQTEPNIPPVVDEVTPEVTTDTTEETTPEV